MTVVRYLFILLFLSALSSESFAKKASIVEVDTFGSNPYETVDNLGEYFFTTTSHRSTHPFNSPVVDLLKYSDNKFTFIESIDFKELFSDARDVSVLDAIKHNNYLLFLVVVDSKGYAVAADAVNGRFNRLYTSELETLSENAQIIKGTDNNFYLADVANLNFTIRHLVVDDEEKKISQNSSRVIGELDSHYSVNDEFFTLTYDDGVIYAVLNIEGGQAQFTEVPLDAQGAILEHSAIVFEDAKSEYYSIENSGDVFYLGYLYSGLQVARLANGRFELIQELTDITAYNFRMLSDNRLLAFSSFNINLFDATSPESLALLNSYSEHSSTLLDIALFDGKLFFAKGLDGIQAMNIDELGEFHFVDNYSNSGLVKDFALKDNVLVSSAYRDTVNVWDITNEVVEKKGHFKVEDYVTGVEFYNDELLILEGKNLNRHDFSDVLNSIDSGTVIGTAQATAEGSIISLGSLGYILHQSNHLTFFDSNLTKRAEIEIENPTFSSGLVQTPLVYQEHLFVRLTGPQNEIIVYDIGDLSTINELTRIELDSFKIDGNITIKDDILYVIESGVSDRLSRFNIKDPNNIVQLESVSIDGYFNHSAAMYVYENYLAVLGHQAYLFDISTDTPTQIDTNKSVSSNGTLIGQNSSIFSVAEKSSGYIKRSEINLAPTHDTLHLALNEDTFVESTLQGVDNEGDAVSYEVLVEPSNGSLEFLTDNSFKYSPDTDFNGSDSVTLKIKDVHGNFTEFTAHFNVNAVNDAPVVSPLNVTVSYNGSTSSSISSTDVDGDTLTYSLVEDVANGSLTLLENGDYSYTANSGFSGTDVFTFEVSDGAETVQGTVTFNVQSAPPPVQNNSESSGGGSMGAIMLLLSLFVYRYRQFKKS